MIFAAAERERLAKTTPLLYAMTMGDEDPDKAGKEEKREKIEEKDEKKEEEKNEEMSEEKKEEEKNM